MKKLVLTLGLVAALMPARAQLFSPESFSGAAFGAMMGSIIGGDCHGPSGKGAAIGAGVGLLAGAALAAAGVVVAVEEGALLRDRHPRTLRAERLELDGGERNRDLLLVDVHVVGVRDAPRRHDVQVMRLEVGDHARAGPRVGWLEPFLFLPYPLAVETRLPRGRYGAHEGRAASFPADDARGAPRRVDFFSTSDARTGAVDIASSGDVALDLQRICEIPLRGPSP